MKTITIIDTGISEKYKLKSLNGRVNGEITFLYDGTSLNSTDGADDILGHGTLVCSAINMINKETSFNFIKAFDNDHWIDEIALILILEKIASSTIKTDILHISCGIQTCVNLKRLENVLTDIRKKGTIIVSAFSNAQIISYPAACSSVIGVMFDTNITSIQQWIYVENSPINIFASGQPKNLMGPDGKLMKAAGASISAAIMTGHIARLLETVDPDNICRELKKLALRCYVAPNIIPQDCKIRPGKIVVFPFNKENHSLVRNYGMLAFNLVDMLDIKYSPYIGRNAFKLLSIMDYGDTDENEDISEKNTLIIQDVMKYDWTKSFDTFVLGHIGLLNDTLSFSMYDYVYNNCLMHHKNLYSYDPIPDYIMKKFEKEGLECYYPYIDESNIKNNHCGMLYEISKPVVGVFGTSSKQGKWSLQLKMRNIFEDRGYRTGHLSTEPQGFLFKNTQTCAVGFNSVVNINQASSVALFNYRMRELEESSDILFFGSQSNVIPYSFGGISTIPFFNYELICACEPQASVLCVNEWDDVEFVLRCIHYLESFNGNKVIALAYFYKDFLENWEQSGFLVHEWKRDYEKIKKISEITQLPVYDMDIKKEVEMLCDDIVNYF